MESIYLSGPMTGIPDLNKPAFNAMARKLRNAGYMVVNPPELDSKEPCGTWEECLQRDLRALTRCDAIATLPGWEKSRGANLEIYVGKALSYPVHPAEYFLKKAVKRKQVSPDLEALGDDLASAIENACWVDDDRPNLVRPTPHMQKAISNWRNRNV